jgi:mannitol-specific phosphotransferase system IIBC component
MPGYGSYGNSQFKDQNDSQLLEEIRIRDKTINDLNDRIVIQDHELAHLRSLRNGSASYVSNNQSLKSPES